MENKITIIEGPTPVFENISDGWAISLNESPILYDTTFTQVRTFNGPALVERCHKVWKKKATIYLHYRNEAGLEEKAPIVAARSMTTDEGQVLLLWLRHLPSLDDLAGYADDDDDESGLVEDEGDGEPE